MTLLLGWAAGVLTGLAAAALAGVLWELHRAGAEAVPLVPDHVPDHLVEKYT